MATPSRVGIIATGFILLTVAACSNSDSGSPLPFPLPREPIQLGYETARGLSNPKEIVAAADHSHLLVLERGSGRIARIDLGNGTIERIGGSFAGLQPEPGGTTALAFRGGPDGTVTSGYDGSLASGPVARIAISSGEATDLPASATGRGFLVDGAAQHFYIWNGGVDRVDIATGVRERLETCADLTPGAVDPSGTWLFESHESTIPYIAAPQPTFDRCDLRDGSTASIPVEGRAETLAFGCGGTVLFRGHTPGVAEPAAEPGQRVLYDGYDPISRELVTTIEAPDDIDIGDPVGPIATTPDCSRIWFASGGGVFELERETYALRRVVTGLSSAAALALDPEGATVVLDDARPSNDRLRRMDLRDGHELEAPYAGTALSRYYGVFMNVALEWLSASNTLAISTGYTHVDRFTLVAASWISRVDLATRTIAVGSSTSSSFANDLASCGAGTTLLAGGSFPIGQGATGQDASALATVSGDQFIKEELPPASHPSGLATLGYASDIAVTPDCQRVYLLASSQVFESDRAHQRMSELPFGDWLVDPRAIALDPSGRFLFLLTGDSIVAMDLRTRATTQVAILEPGLKRIAVTASGEIVFAGGTTTALGVVDLVQGRARRLWEGPGTPVWTRDIN